MTASQQLRAQLHAEAFAISEYAIGVTRARDGVYVYANPKAVKLLGLSDLEELVGRSTVELGIWADEQQRDTYLKEVQKGVYAHPRLELTNRDGSPRAEYMFSRFSEVDGEQYIITMSVDATPLLEVEQALARSEAKFAAIFDQNATPMLISSWRGGSIESANSALVQLLGLNPERLHEMSTAIWYHPDQLADMRQRMIADGQVDGAEVSLRRVNGTEIPVLYFARRVEVNDEVYAAAQFIDLSAIRSVEEKLAESEQRFTQLFYESPVASALISTGPPRIVDVNNTLADLLGYTAAELIELGTLASLALEPEARLAFIEQITAQGRSEAIMDFMTRSGERVPLEMAGRVLKLGGETMALVTFRDLRERREFERSLTLANDRMERAQSVAMLGDFVWNLDSDVIEGSRECLRILGFAAADRPLTGARVGDIIREEDRALVAEAMRARVFDYECRIHPADGGPQRHIRSWGTIEQDRDSGARIVNGVTQDVTAKKEAELEQARLAAKMEESQRLESLGLLAGGIAHDFNNLLAGIMGNADFALTEEGLPPAVRDRLDDVVTASRRAADLTRQLLAYSGRGHFVIQTVDLTELVEEMANLLQISVGASCSLELDLEEALPPVEVDPTQLRQVIMNLILNAAEAIDDGHGVVRLTTGRQTCDARYLRECALAEGATPGEFSFVEVEDNGSGMDAATRRRIFEPFFTTKFTGRGLGMSAVRGIVKGHSGLLDVHSEAGKGTRFRVLLPASQPAEEEPAVAGGSERASGSGCVLVVDDEDGVRELIERVLRQRGYEVLSADGGAGGIELYRKHAARVDVVLLDLTMPDVGGAEVFEALIDTNPNVNVVLMSGYDEQDAVQAFVGRRLAGFLPKPFLVDELIGRLHGVLAASEATVER